jgi:hypothetical protein
MLSKVVWSLVLSVLLTFSLSGQKPSDEMDVRKPEVIIFPPPPFIGATAKDGKLIIRFREIGVERVKKYNLYKFENNKWHLMGSSSSSPVELLDCVSETAKYGIAAVDKSEAEGSMSKFSADYSCSKLNSKSRPR